MKAYSLPFRVLEFFAYWMPRNEARRALVYLAGVLDAQKERAA